MKSSASTPANPVSEEAAAWRAVGAGWRQLHGSFHRLGFSFEWHDFEAANPLDWARSFHPESVELCLNLAGTGEVSLNGTTARFGELTAGFYRQAKTPLSAVRHAAQRHQFITVELSPDFLKRHLGGFSDNLHPIIAAATHRTDEETGISQPAPMNMR